MAVAGTYSWATVPLAAASALLFIVSGARVAGSGRAIDLAIIAAIAVFAVQLVPLPAPVVRAVSPAAVRLQDLVALQPFNAWRPLSIHAAATRESVLLAITAALIFWSARAILSRGGARLLCSFVAAIGFVVAVVALAQHATAPTTIYWRWMPVDPGARPYGPFIDRNHLATWLIMAISLSAGAVAVRLSTSAPGVRALMLEGLAGSTVLGLGALGMMLIALVATLSRSGMVGLVAAAGCGAMLGARTMRRRSGLTAAAALAILLLALAFWTNAQGLTARVESTLATVSPVSRLMIWRDTLGIVRDFPWMGTGAGTFADVMIQYQRSATRILFNHAHNEYLQLLAEGGIVGAGCVAFLVVLFARAARKAIDEDRSTKRFIRIAAAAGLTGIAVQSVWDTGLRTPANLVLAAVLAALVLRDLQPLTRDQ